MGGGPRSNLSLVWVAGVPRGGGRVQTQAAQMGRACVWVPGSLTWPYMHAHMRAGTACTLTHTHAHTTDMLAHIKLRSCGHACIMYMHT